MTPTFTDECTADDLRASAIVLHYAASMFLNAANAAGDRSSVAAGQSILEALTQVMPEAPQLSA